MWGSQLRIFRPGAELQDLGRSRFCFFNHRLLGSCFLGLLFRILNINHQKELLRSLWVTMQRLPDGTLRTTSVLIRTSPTMRC